MLSVLVHSQLTANYQIIPFAGELVLSYLKRSWLGVDGKPEKGAAHTENLQTLLQ